MGGVIKLATGGVVFFFFFRLLAPQQELLASCNQNTPCTFLASKVPTPV